MYYEYIKCISFNFSYSIWRHFSLSGLTPIIFNMNLTNLGTEASICIFCCFLWMGIPHVCTEVSLWLIRDFCVVMTYQNQIRLEWICFLFTDNRISVVVTDALCVSVSFSLSLLRKFRTFNHSNFYSVWKKYK